MVQIEFNPKKLTDDVSIIAIVGKRGTGKTTLADDLLCSIGCASLTCIDVSKDSKDNSKDSNIATIRQLIQNQKIKIGECLASGGDPETDCSLNVWVLIENFTHDTQFVHSEEIKSLFMNSKLWKIGVIICFQYVSGRLPLVTRTKIDYLFCLKDNNIDDQQKLYTTFFENYGEFSHFQDIFVSCTQNYGCLVLDRTNMIVSHYTADVQFYSSFNIDVF